jgi:hypothetical protein
MRSIYKVYYISSSGQPANGVREFTDRTKALACARSYDGSLLHLSGGCSVCREYRDGKVRDLRVWIEHCEGGFLSVAPARATEWDTDYEAQEA